MALSQTERAVSTAVAAAAFVDARVLSIFEGADETLCLRVIARRLAEAEAK